MEDSSHFIEKMMELGIGMSMIKQMPGLIEGAMPKMGTPMQSQSQMAQGQTIVPPPLPTQQEATTYIVADNTQAGPFTEQELIKLIQNDLLKQDTWVWKQGMPKWMSASQVPDVNKLFLMAKIK